MPETFASVIATEIDDYLAMREAGGIGSTQTRYHLLSLDGFCIRSGLDRKELPREVVEQWADAQPGSVNVRRSRLSTVRGLAVYLNALGIPAYMPHLPKRGSTYTPYLFTEEELAALFASTDALHGQRGRLSSAVEMMPVLFRVLYGTGLRLGEALSLRWEDVDEQAGVLLIRKAKNDRQRYTPMSASLGSILTAYRSSGICAHSASSTIFSDPSGKTVTQTQVRSLFERALADIGIENPRTSRGQRGICPHCLRHLFTVHSFLKMEEEGRSFLESNPYLSAYLGHENLACTNQYLNSSHTMHRREQAKMEDACEGVFPEVDFDEQ
ncbi:MAG: tyrosine-type recombinase/integrase [Coriobacteriales bacterium]|jgi:integrase|nr:tyrosine-type recombinase/integrase [Coriobacteriales bacterium]